MFYLHLSHSMRYLSICLHRCKDSECFELKVFPLSGETSTAKREMLKKNSFNSAGERAVRGTVVAQQMKIDTDN